MRVSNVRKTILYGVLGTIFCSLAVLSGIMFFSHGVSAGNVTGANGGKPPANTPCGGLNGHSTFCGEFGVSWRYYTLSQVSSIANYSGPASTCAEEDVEGIWILAYEWVNGDGSFQGKQVLDRPNKNVHVAQVQPPYSTGWYKFVGPTVLADTKDWTDAKEAYEYYKSAFDGNTSWENTTWFCGNEDPGPRTGAIKANSGINVSGVSGDKTGADVGSKNYDNSLEKTATMTVSVQTSIPQISGQIWHNQYYKNTSDGWAGVKQKAKKYKGITLDLYWDVKGGKSGDKYDACDGKWTCDTLWAIPAKETTDKQEKVGSVNYTVNAGDEYCHTMTVEPTKFKFNNSEGVTDEAGRAHTRACVNVSHVDKPKPPTDEFKANSSVEVPNASSQLGGYDPGKQTSDWDKAVGLKVSTDSDSLQFTLSHNMSFSIEDSNRNIWRYWDSCAYTVGSGENITCVGDWVYVGSSTSLSYELTGDTGKVAENSKSENGTYKAGIDKNTQNQNELVASNTYTISGMEPGKTYRVCHKIKYTPKSYTTPITEKLIWTGPWSIGPQWIYGTPQANGDSEDSEACIEITRPENPPEGGDPDPYGPKNNGSSNADVMFAGEQTNIGWKVEAKSVPTRRVTDYSAVGFVVRDDVASAAAMNSGMAHQPSDPCAYFGSKAALVSFGGTTCAEFSGDGLSVAENTDGLSGIKIEKIPSSSGAFTKQINIAVPDNVGAKYCNSYGYKWGYWYGVVKGETAENLTDDAATWTHVNGKDYWTNYSPACRTIAKKPNFAIWNGSIFSGGGIVSSTAPRHNDANSGQPTKLNDDGNKTTYGSWAENLAVAGSNISRFASSGAYGAGLPGLVSGNNWNMAWLTISNDGLKSSGSVLGNSGINYNSSYDTRLSAYLKGSATNDVSNQSATTYPGASGVAGTQILYFNPGGTNGTLTINGNVTLDSAKKENIYELPQVVIYVDGNIAIDPSVTRLDTWLIATGDIDTCKGWQDNTTETRSLNRNTNATCDNQLQINGPVIANSVKLHRTFGADNLVSYTGSHGAKSEKNVSSEVFNLSALTYLWSFAQAGRYQSSYTDVYSRELAPRY